MNPHLSPLLLFAGIASLAAIAALYAWTSRINQFFFFARTLSPSFTDTPAARTITVRYVGMVFISAGLSVLTFTLLYSVYGRSVYVSLVSSIVMEAVLFNLAFARAHHVAGSAYAVFEENTAMADAVEHSNHARLPADRTIAVSLLPAQK